MTCHRRHSAATILVALLVGASIGAVSLAGSPLRVAAITHPGPLNLDPLLTVQDKNLDCEAAALAAAFVARKIAVNTGTSNLQNWIFNQLPDDHRNAIDTGGNITWGDPYDDFVGNVNGREGFAPGDGYGVYYQPIANVVTEVGHTEVAKTGWTTATIEAELEAGNPVVVWIDFRSLASGAGYSTDTWTAFDGRKVPYTLHEHAVTVLGTYPGHSITLLDVYSGNQYTYSESQFARMLSTFHGMAVAVGPAVVVTPPFPVVVSLAPAAGPATGGQVVTVTGTGFAASMTVSLGGTAITPQRITTTSFNITTPAHAAGYDRLQVTTSKGSSALSANSGYVFTSLASYVAVTPFRILDTRARTCVQCGAGGLASNQTRTLQITGVTGLKGGADQVPATATAIVMNVTAVSGRTGGLLTIYPTGTALPRASNLNFNAGTVTPNLVTVTLGQTSAASPNWAVNIFNPIGSLDVVADIEGYFAPNASGDPAGEFHAMSPLRVCDTRAGQAANVCNQGTGTGHRLGPNSVVKVNVSGLPSGVFGAPASIPSDGTAQAAVLNLTATGGTLPTYLSVFPSRADGSCPTASTTSTINLNGGATEANRVMVSLGADATGAPATDVCVYNAVGSIDFVLDANGWFGSSLTSTPLGAQFQAIGPTRVCDTRVGSATPCSSHTLGADATLSIGVAGVGGVPKIGPVAVIANLTAVAPSTSTYLIAYPADVTPRPNASDLNIVGPVLPNLVVVGLSHLAPGGNIRLFNANGNVNAVLDVEGWFQ
ncbi:MAG: IPT/TIG domain-containing protein [Candidatus Dormiibacterota bacterium]